MCTLFGEWNLLIASSCLIASGDTGDGRSGFSLLAMDLLKLVPGPCQAAMRTYAKSSRANLVLNKREQSGTAICTRARVESTLRSAHLSSMTPVSLISKWKAVGAHIARWKCARGHCLVLRCSHDNNHPMQCSIQTARYCKFNVVCCVSIWPAHNCAKWWPSLQI